MHFKLPVLPLSEVRWITECYFHSASQDILFLKNELMKHQIMCYVLTILKQPSQLFGNNICIQYMCKYKPLIHITRIFLSQTTFVKNCHPYNIAIFSLFESVSEMHILLIQRGYLFSVKPKTYSKWYSKQVSTNLV